MFPIHIDLYFTRIHYYEGLYFLISILAGYVLSRKRFVYAGLTDHPNVENHIFVSLIFAIIGARLSDSIFWNWSAFLSNPVQMLSSFSGNSIVGGLFGGMLGGWVYSRIKGINYWPYFAAASPAILFAQAIGRLGCFLNGDAFGTVTALPWGIRFPRFGLTIPQFQIDLLFSSPAWVWSYEHGLVGPSSIQSAPLHPAQLYELVLDLFLMLLILRTDRITEIRNKIQIFWLHIGGYSFLRFLLEFIRADRTALLPPGLSLLQYTLLAISLWALAMFLIRIFMPPVSRRSG